MPEANPNPASSIMSQTTIAPHDQSPYVTRKLETDLEGIVEKAYNSQRSWRKVQIEERIAIGHRFVVSWVFTLVGECDIQPSEIGRITKAIGYHSKGTHPPNGPVRTALFLDKHLDSWFVF
jgi:hypothetical protein